MPRGVRKVTLYVCTFNGSIHTSAAEAKAEAARLREQAAASAKAKKAKSSTRGNQTARILELLNKAPRRPVEIRKQLARAVPAANVAPTLNRLKKQGLVTAKGGEYSLTAKGRKRAEA